MGEQISPNYQTAYFNVAKVEFCAGKLHFLKFFRYRYVEMVTLLDGVNAIRLKISFLDCKAFLQKSFS